MRKITVAALAALFLLLTPAVASAHWPTATLNNVKQAAKDDCIHKHDVTRRCWPSDDKPGPGNWTFAERRMRIMSLRVDTTGRHVAVIRYTWSWVFCGCAKETIQINLTFFHGGRIYVSNRHEIH